MDSSLSDNLNSNKENILHEFSIKETIGKGTFSSVKLGENKKTKEKVAIKIMQKNKIINKEDLMRINREIDILKSLSYHPNVIKIYKILEDSENYYIIMEYCENGELFYRIVEKQQLNEDESAIFYYQLICGVEFIHKNNITHRDLKPENLLLTKDDILKIIDFGLSHYSNNLMSTPCGSPCYASPEMVSGKKYNGLLIDIWSTGIILFAMICGYLPFEDEDNDILFEKILNCNIEYPDYVGELPLDLMEKILVNDPNKRINLNEIKEHPFFLKGKMLFNQKHPDFNNQKVIENIKLIIEEKLSDKNHIINNIDNSYQPSIKENNENYDYNRKLTDNTFTNENLNKKNDDYNNIENIHNNNNDKQKNDEIINNNYKKDDSSYLKSGEIPMNSTPQEFNNQKESNSYINNNKEIEKKEDTIKDNININSNNIQKSPQNISSNTIEKNNLNRPKLVEMNLEEDFNKNRKEIKDNTIKNPQNNLKNHIDINNDKRNKYKKRTEHLPNQNLNTTNDDKTTTNKNNKDIINSKYSKISQKIPETSYAINKTNSINNNNNTLINELNTENITNSTPKNNYKINNYTEHKYPHNNHNKINNIYNTFYQKYKNISEYNKKNLENNSEKTPRINHTYSKIEPKLNLYKNKDINNKQRIYKQKCKKKNKEPNNSYKRLLNSYNNNNFNNILENDSFIEEENFKRNSYIKKKTKIPKFNVNKYKN